MKKHNPSRQELRTEVIKALVRLKVRSPAYWDDLQECLERVELAGLKMPPKPRHLRVVQNQTDRVVDA